MIDRRLLLADLQALLRTLQADLLERSESAEVPDVGRRLHTEYERAKQAERTAQNYEDWRRDYITQAAAAWVLSCVFVRFLEDNRLIDPPKIAGPGERLQWARDEHERYFRAHPKETDRDYLLGVFDELARLPGGKDVFGEHNPVRELPNWLSGDAATEMLRFFLRIDADAEEANRLIHDFTDPQWDTRFLGDLYQDLSEEARKKYALLQTPEFVEEFILDRTLEPALDEFGLDAPPVLDRDGEAVTGPGFRMIDPACGSGHFLLGAFPRVLKRWERKEPDTPVCELVQRALDSIHGVDVNPYAVAIARFRLLLAAMRACEITRLADAPGFHLNLVCGDSLRHGTPGGEQLGFGFTDPYEHVYRSERGAELKRILIPKTYHAVVANPPYITPKDRAANQAYRAWSACHMKYSLAVPFMQRIFGLAVDHGFTGQITANSFMKREFGKKLIEEFLPNIDLTHVIDTSGAYIPGHGTPTVILFGRNRKPVTDTIRTVMGIRGEPSTPDDPARGLVWSAIVAQIDKPGSQTDFVSVGDSSRELFRRHPWSIGGGGAAELKEQLEDGVTESLKNVIDEIGVFGITAADDVMYAPDLTFRRYRVEDSAHRRLILGDEVRDWQVAPGDHVLFPYADDKLIDLRPDTGHHRWLWPNRTTLWARATFSRLTYRKEGRTWWEWHQTTLHRLHTLLSIVYGEVATHNHFVLDRGGKVFKQTAPVIKLPADATEDDHLALLGLLNSSTACFWLKQVCHQKQMMGGDGIRIESKAKVPYAFNATQVGRLPVPDPWRNGPLRDRLVELTRRMDQVTQEYAALAASAAIESTPITASAIRSRWSDAQSRRAALRSQQVFLQEEIDFTTYRVFNLVTDQVLADQWKQDGVLLQEGDRPFCILDGQNEDGFPVPAGIPERWPVELRRLWERRIQEIQDNHELRLIECSMYKRRWIGRQGLFNHQRRDNELKDAAVEWLTNRLESYFDFDGRMRPEADEKTSDTAVGDAAGPITFNFGGPDIMVTFDAPTPLADIRLVSVARLADVARQDAEFMQVGELYRDDQAFDVERLVAELVEAENVPLLPALRYKASGLRKRAEWERTWDLQRLEDRLAAGEEILDLGSWILEDEKVAAIRDWQSNPDPLSTKTQALSTLLDIPVPPKYKSSDFQKSDYWRLRGKLDVPKERWVSFPHCEGQDGTLTIAWAGYDHLQLARAISGHYVDIQEHVGGRDDPRLVPLLACLIELLPWLKQWHNDPDPEFGVPMGDYFEGFVAEEARQMGITVDEIRAWEPPRRAAGRRRQRRKGGGAG